MKRPPKPSISSPGQAAGEEVTFEMLPSLSTAEEIARPIKVTSRTILAWAAADIIPVALRQGRIVRFSPSAVAKALGL